MSRPAHLRLSRALPSFLPLTACLLCVAACNNTCFSLSLNSPGSKITVKVADPPPSCTLTTANRIVHLEIGAATGLAFRPGVIGPHIAHLYVALAGVDAHPSALATDDTPGWQALASPVQAHPIQIDFLADSQANASTVTMPDAVLPAGVYQQIRLRLASPLLNQPSFDETVLQLNTCGAGVPHCVVLSDGRVWPVAFSPATPNLHVFSEGLPGGELYVPPDSRVSLKIEFDTARSFLWLSRDTGAWSSGDSLLLSATFRVSVLQPLGVPNS